MNDIFGKKLQKARVARGISVHEAAEATRMRPEKILALESSDLSKFASAAYAKSFLLLYARYLRVDVKEIAATIDTGTHLTFDDYSYLRNADLPEMSLASRPDAPTATGYSAPSVRMPERTSLLPLVVLGCVGLIALFAYMLRSNLARLAEPVAEEKTVPTLLPKTAMTPSAQVPAPSAQIPVPATPAASPVVAAVPPVLAVPPVPPIPKAVPITPVPATPPGATPTGAAPAVAALPTPKPGEPEVRAAVPKNKANQLTVNDAEALIELGDMKTPAANAVPADVQDEEENALGGEMVFIEPKRKVQVVVRRDGPDGKVEFQDVLHPRAHGLRLPAGKWFIQVPEAGAVEISRKGVAVPYSEAGVLVE